MRREGGKGGLVKQVFPVGKFFLIIFLSVSQKQISYRAQVKKNLKLFLGVRIRGPVGAKNRKFYLICREKSSPSNEEIPGITNS